MPVAPSRAETPAVSEKVVETQHTVDMRGKAIRYTARAGVLPLYTNDTGELMARMFFVAYIAEPKRNGPARPLTFVWGGGPGANSSLLHLVGLGPRALEARATYPDWIQSPPTRLADNQDTWLKASDLVFVDPIGTGYSRAVSAEARDILYTTRGDIEAVAEFIRLYRTRFDAWDSPFFIAGESYGTTRAMGVADALEKRRAGLSGVVLISGGYDAGQKVDSSLADALQVSMYAAAAHFHGRFAPELQALSRDDAVARATDWARRVYAPALARRDDLSPAERANLLVELTANTGVDPEFIDKNTLTISKSAFADRLLDKDDLELGHYDLRLRAKRRDLKTPWLPTEDPSIKPMVDLMQGTFAPAIRYIRDDLGFASDLLYRGPFGGAFHPEPLRTFVLGEKSSIDSDWMTMMWNANRPVADEASSQSKPGQPGAPTVSDARPPLQRAMVANSSLLVMNVTGLYDGSCAAKDEALAQTEPALRLRVRNFCYAAGHMLYSDTEVRNQLERDFEQFVSDAVKGSGKKR